MHSEALLVTQFAFLDSKIYLKSNLGVQNEPCGQNRNFWFFLKKFEGTAMQFKKLYSVMITSI